MAANNAYSQGQYKKALGLYQSLHNKSWAVLYNMGNCWFKLGDYVQAIAYWKRAQEQGGVSYIKQIEHNIKQAQNQLHLPEHHLELFDRLYLKMHIPPIMLQLLFLLLFYGIILYGPIFFGLLRAHKRYIVGIILGIMVALVSIGIFVLNIMQYQRRTRIQGIVKNTVELVAGTDERFSKIGKIAQGNEVAILDRCNAWCKIADDKQTGWTQESNVEII